MKYIYTISFLCFYLINYGQINCGTIAPITDSALNSAQERSDCSWCDDIPGIIENCDEIWINVTMHFISNDDCSGDIQWQDNNGEYVRTAEEVIEDAQDMFDNANAIFEGMDESLNWGMDCFPLEGGGTPYTEPICMPLRFRFAGVEFHCSDELSIGTLSGTFLTNDDDHVHITFVERPGSGDGIANLGTNAADIERFSGSLLIHEILHLFGIHHTGPGHANGCDDLPVFDENMEWYNPFTDEDEDVDACFNDSPTYYDDATGEITDLCDPAIFNHGTHPCCDPCNLSNNLMSYTGFTEPGIGTLSPCQINTVLASLCQDNCDLVDIVIPQDFCPPVSAFAFQPPGSLYESGDCEICFGLSASSNLNAYRISLLDDSGNTLHQGAWIQGQPGTFCIASTSDESWDYGLEHNSSYTLVLTGANQCGDVDQFTLEFNTPRDCEELMEPCYNLPPEIKKPLGPITSSGGSYQREICWKDVDAEFYEVSYQLPGMEPVTTIVSGTCFTTPPFTNVFDLRKLQFNVVAICDCSDDPPNFEVEIVGDPCNSNAQLCLNLSDDDLSSEFYEIEWFGPNGLISSSQNGPTCISINSNMPDGEYYASIVFYWGGKYTRVKCSAVSSIVRKNCNCPNELTLDYEGGRRGLICRGRLQVCVSDDYGYIGSDEYNTTITWSYNGSSSGVSYNGDECMTFPPGTTSVSVTVTYSDSNNDIAFCQLSETIVFNCECPDDFLVEESEIDCKTFCIETDPQDLLIPGYFTVAWTNSGVFPPETEIDENLCRTFSQNGFYSVTLQVYSDLNHDYMLCTLGPKSFTVSCEGEGRNLSDRNNDHLAGELIAYPNPFHDKFYIESPEEIKGKLVIYSTLGKVIFTKNLNLQERESLGISTEGFSAGVYLVKIYNDTGIQFETKMIKLD